MAVNADAKFDTLPIMAERSLDQKREDARRRIAFSLIGLYIVMVLANIGVPVGLYITSGPTGPLTLADTKDLTLAISAVLGNLVGILGVVVGFYFKSLGDEAKSRSTKG